ncbi:Adipocyte plasma membrane-associated protein [Orchesella cincta]|uniref:Adipocyte plasma membrane-associated protein n=1 Tax=Orchesella cincta TaxID=48709 RepID=A0A1D2MWD0_ORCCI|nr:Adipocyte plasma membrane-associated protein [Orchesella cincta]
MGVITLAVQLVLLTVVGALLLIFVPGLPPDMKFEAYTVPPPLKLEGKLAPNAKLDRAELVFDGEFVGPESIAIRKDEVYTGVIGGYIIRYKNDKWEKIVQTGKPCAGYWEYGICGRPLGLRFEPSGKLLVADATQGLLRVDVDKKTVETLLPRNAKSDGSEQTLNFADDVDVTAKDGLIYFSDAGQFGTFGDSLIDMIGEPTGRLIEYDPKTKKSKALLTGIRFANGVQLSKNQDFLVLNEMGLSRVLKYHLKGPKKGTSEVLIDRLPGYPDNVRSNGKGGFYISLLTSRFAESPNMVEQIAPIPLVRKLILRFQCVLVKICEFVNLYAPNEYIEKAIVYIKHVGPFGDVTSYPDDVTIVEIDENGNILGSLQKKEGKIACISEIAIADKYTYLGSPFTSQLWRIKNEYIS